uniref:Centrosomal protein 192 n=1 Tax=Scophthalmus maximus TaxID=52904 RepID=A0A8D3AF30_SCOMX
MADSFYKLEDEVLPSFLCESGVDSFSGGRATLGNVTLGSGPGLPVAASTVARVRPRADNRWEATTNGVVYQNEEGQWVTDLAYYSSFAKEVDGKTSEDTSDAMEKIVKDQEEFEKEHQFIQEEKIEPAASNNDTFQSDSSWKAPTNSHVLMRTSQVCSDFKQGDQSYLRLSFGEFFGQRSEALGCLGNMSDVDGVKRPSFGYIITSPEKREPFPLIHPTEFSATVTSAHSDTMELSDADKTLSPGDHTVCAAPPHPNDDSGSESSLCNQSGVPHDNSSSPLMLSISTIASAIADASISTDPSQLAAMIMELSKRSKARKHPTCAGAVGPAPGSTEEPHSSEHTTSSSSRYLCFSELPEGFPESCVEQTQCNFRPSTSPLTHSSPSQTSIPSTNGYCIMCFSCRLYSILIILLIRNLLWLKYLLSQVVVPVELRFPHACCVGIASQTSLSLFNPSERWQQVSITVTGLAIDGEKVSRDLSYQWLIIKNKTIIGPKSTEEQKVLFIPPQAGVYQCVLSVCSWPASAETEVAARASIFARRVVLVAIAENPAVEVEASKSGYLDFGDLPGGSAKSLPLKLLNKTHATVPVRLVISANATAWRCFNFSKHPGVMTSEAAQQAGHISPVSSPSVMNHVMHASYGENPESIMVWVHFKAPQKYTCSGELGPPDEYIARVDIELDSPGPSRVICSVPLSARSGTARVHAPKDLQVVKLPYGFFDDEGSFSVTPDELFLRVGEEQEVTVSFKAQASRKCRESLLTILVLPSGPQYEVTLTGAVAPEDSGKPAVPSAAVFGAGLTKDIPPILSNKQFIAWGGVTLGRAVQQKLVLRNNSTSATQQLRLLIRGQDQDCFQLQSMFSPEERLTRHGELSIRPREDVTVHLLFAPTRVASMLAKLEIKQSGVRPSQPGVKFTIPLSGYGGTSNIILEDQRKQADSYLAMLTDVAVGRVSKVCLCVRNTGSRAAFIKAMAFSDVQTRSVLQPSVISLAPSQFVLKERTQEDELNSANALLATICLFCGDEVSRQQYRRLLQSKPEAARKALSENSLLKNIDFNEKFLGEENVTETCDLPQRPNEAHIFYGNMSKVVVSLLGSTRSADCEEREHELLLPPSARRVSETDSVLANGSVSLDVLPVKGPQGPALRATEPSFKVANKLYCYYISDGAASTSQIQIRNNTSRELSFDLSWPAHCLTITPQHGVIDPQCHLQILISPNPSLATKPALLPWSGQVYVQCDGQQKFIKVQIRQDLALDVSAAPADRTLSALPALAATPVLPVARLPTGPSLALQTPQTPQAPPALVEISNKTIVFPITPSGETSEAQLEVQNGEVEVRWYLSSFAPPYVKGVDNTGDVYRATYTAFRCSRVSGTLGAHEKMQVPITFLPRDRGDYAQFWDLECHPVSEPQLKTRGRFQLCSPASLWNLEDDVLCKMKLSLKCPRRYISHLLNGNYVTCPVFIRHTLVTLSQEEAVWRGVYSPQDLYTFPATRAGESSTLKVSIRNNSSSTHELKFVNTKEPFHIKHSKYSLRSQHYLKLPVQFRPSTAGRHVGSLLVQSETSGSLVIQLIGEAAWMGKHL